MRDITIYGNGSAGNHGCEALTRSLTKILTDNHNSLWHATFNLEEDILYGLDKITQLKPITNTIDSHTFSYLLYRIKQHLHYSDKRYYRLLFQEFLNQTEKGSLYLSAGGDNYSYKNDCWLQVLNEGINKRGGISILAGCSIADSIRDQNQIADFSRYRTIVARESITFKALMDAHVKADIHCVPDPAFQLDTTPIELPDGFVENNTIGINLSPMVIERENNNGCVIDCYKRLIDHLITNSDMQIALIPHVVWEHNDDRVPLRLLYDKFKNTGRIIFIEDHNATKLKSIIAKCRFMVAARTHASIAAYSTQVPTLVIGYSVKARGIATDIFGKSERYVVPVQSLRQHDDLITAFNWIWKNEDNIRKHYQTIMPEYADKAMELKDIINRI